MIAETDVRTCRGCGCTDEQCCEGGCWWVEDEDVFSDLCPACVTDAANTRVLDECELHFLRDCGECAEADVILLQRSLP